MCNCTRAAYTRTVYACFYVRTCMTFSIVLVYSRSLYLSICLSLSRFLCHLKTYEKKFNQRSAVSISPSCRDCVWKSGHVCVCSLYTISWTILLNFVQRLIGMKFLFRYSSFFSFSFFFAHIFFKKRICINGVFTVSPALYSIRIKQLLHRCAAM